jgi:hypothetical protein
MSSSTRARPIPAKVGDEHRLRIYLLFVGINVNIFG